MRREAGPAPLSPLPPLTLPLILLHHHTPTPPPKGALVGAGTTAAYYNGVDVIGVASSVLRGKGGGGGGGSSSSPDVDRLVALVERLARDRGGVTVVHGSGGPGSGCGGVITVLFLLAGGGFVAARLAGASIADCLFTTRAQLKASVAGVAAGVDALAGKLAGARAYFAGRVDDLAADTAALGAAVGRVGEDVGRARADVAAVHGEVRGLASGMAALEAGQRDARAALHLANEGVYLLCRVVCDLMRAGPGEKGSGRPISAAAAALDEYVRRPAGVASAVRCGGLGSLLPSSDDTATGTGGFYGPPRPGGGGTGGGASFGLDDDALGLGSGLGVYGGGAAAATWTATPTTTTPSSASTATQADLGSCTRRPMPATAGAFGWLF
jgi:hypothetical protein